MKKVFKIIGIVLGSIVGAFLIFVAVIVIYSTSYKVEVEAHHDNDTGYIQAYGRGLYDANGDEIILNGTNFGAYFVTEGWLMPYTIFETSYKANEPDQPEYVDETGSETVSQDEFLAALEANPNNFSEQDIEDILEAYYTNWLCEDDVQNVKDLGLNCIRVPFGYRMLLNDNLTRKDEAEAFKYMDQILTWCKDVGGVYVVFDLHTTPGSHNGYEHSGVTEYASGRAACNYIKFWDNQEYVNAIVDLWKFVSEHYSKSENAELSKLIAMYDIFNEPIDVTYSGDKKVWDVMDKVYDALRANNDPHVICLEGCWSFLALPDPADYGWTNVCYSYHWYNFSQFNWTLFFAYEDMFNMFCDYEVPVFQGEFTFFDDPEVWEKGLKLFSDRHYSWTTWTYKKVVDGWWNDSWSIYNLNLLDHSDEVDGVFHIDGDSYIERINVATATKEEIINYFATYLKTDGNCNIVDKVQFGDGDVIDITHSTYEAITKFTNKTE